MRVFNSDRFFKRRTIFSSENFGPGDQNFQDQNSRDRAIFRILSFFLDHDERYLANGLSTHSHFSTKLILITTRISTTNRRLHSFNFTLVNKSHSQHSVTAVRCEGRHFVILYACAQVVSFPYQIIRSSGTVSSCSSGQGL